MEDLVKNTKIVDAELVRAVTALLPGESLERILDETRNITLKRVLGAVKSRQFSTVIHLVEHLKTVGLTWEDAAIVMNWMHEDRTVPDNLADAITALLGSGLLKSVFEFVSEIEEVPPNKCICCLHPRAD
jgi:hypothetical protein